MLYIKLARISWNSRILKTFQNLEIRTNPKISKLHDMMSISGKAFTKKTKPIVSYDIIIEMKKCGTDLKYFS